VAPPLFVLVLPMSTLTLVLWLSNGEKYGEWAAPDGYVPSFWSIPICQPMSWDAREYAAPPRAPELHTVDFHCTDPQSVSALYALGRRRFHYIERTGWLPRSPERDLEELEPEHVRERRARGNRVNDAVVKQLELMRAGQFPPRRDD
jgi:hypothetical protein